MCLFKKLTGIKMQRVNTDGQQKYTCYRIIGLVCDISIHLSITGLLYACLWVCGVNRQGKYCKYLTLLLIYIQMCRPSNRMRPSTKASVGNHTTVTMGRASWALGHQQQIIKAGTWHQSKARFPHKSQLPNEHNRHALTSPPLHTGVFPLMD